ncbi:MAG: DUF6785 family protein [Thermoproteota archaeon]
MSRESSDQATSEEEYVSILKPAILVMAALMPLVFFFLNIDLHAKVEWWVWPAWFPPHFFIILLVIYLWSRLTRRPMMRPQYLVAIFTICYLVSGWSYMLYGIHYWTMFPMFTGSYGYWIHGLWDETYRTLTWNAFPAFTAPHSIPVLEAYYRGGAFDFGPWLPSMLFFSLWMIVVYIGSYFFVLPLYKPLVKVERLPFPYAAAAAHTIQWSTAQPEDKTFLFSLKSASSKAFWIGFVIGMMTYLPSVISALTPITFPIYLISPPVNTWIQSYMTPILPGAKFDGWFAPAEVVLAAFAPMDTLFTAFLYWLITAVIYPVVGVKMGFLPYYQGIESTAVYFQEEGPFKADWFAYWGVVPGVAIWMIYRYRDNFINIFKVGLNPKKYPDLAHEEEGLSYRMIALGIIGFLILLIVMWIAVGANPLMSIIGPVYFILYMYGWVRVQAEGMHTASSTYHILPFYDMGAALGQWGPRPDPRAITSLTAFLSTGQPGFERQSAVSMPNQFLIYKISYENKTRLKDIFIITIITVVSASIVVTFLTPWWYAVNGGRETLGMVEYHQWNWSWIWNLTGGTPPWKVTMFETIGYTFGGIAFTFIAYYLRARFTWFLINPIGIALPAVWGMSHGMFWTWAFLIKLIVLRAGGARAFERYYTPFAIGFAMGTGVLYFFASIIVLFTRVLPLIM